MARNKNRNRVAVYLYTDNVSGEPHHHTRVSLAARAVEKSFARQLNKNSSFAHYDAEKRGAAIQLMVNRPWPVVREMFR